MGRDGPKMQVSGKCDLMKSNMKKHLKRSRLWQLHNNSTKRKTTEKLHIDYGLYKGGNVIIAQDMAQQTVFSHENVNAS